jgi:prepilin-type N-terminal cleavage/methylation domain-containing protein
MSADGYTLTEMLAALAILGLAFGGLTEGARVIGATQARTLTLARRAEAGRGAQAALERTLEGQGPFVSDGRGGFNGAPTAFSFDCQAGRCGAQILPGEGHDWLIVREGSRQSRSALPASGGAFAFVDAFGRSPVWPANPPRPTRLTSVLVEGPQDARVLAAAHLWTEEPRDCVFDAIAQGCRS